MPRTDERGGPQTRARIAEIASGLFLERGFDAVTVAQVARAAGVSTVTVYNHFPRKEDLYLDRSDDAITLLRGAIRDRELGVDVLSSLEAMTTRLLEIGSPLAGADDRSIPFFRTIAGSPALIARARELAAELQSLLATELADDVDFDGDAGIVAALFLGGYGSVLVRTAARLIADEARGAVMDDHRARFAALFTALRNGVA